MSITTVFTLPDDYVFSLNYEKGYGFIGNNQTGGAVLPDDYENTSTGSPLRVTTSTADLIIAPGRAYVNGYLYENTANATLSPDTAVNNRYDAVVLDYDTANKTVRAALVKGTEAAAPVYPTVPASDVILAYVYIYAGFTSGVSAINQYNVQDQRVFFANGWERSRWFGDRRNLVPNSEFLAFAGGTNLPPDRWYKQGSPNITRNTSAKSVPRGFTLELDGTVANDSVGTYFVANAKAWPQYGADIPITALVRMKLDSGKQARVRFGAEDLASMTIFEQQSHYYRDANEFDVLLRANIPVGTLSNGVLRLEIEDLNPATAGSIYITYVSAGVGFIPLAPSIYNELIMYDYVIADSNWDGTTGYSSGTTQIDLTTDWSGIVPPEIRFMIARFAIRDSGSAAAAEGACECELRYPGASDYLIRLSAAGRTNDDWVEQVVYIPIDNDNAGNPAFDVVVTATGATTMDVILLPIGIIT